VALGWVPALLVFALLSCGRKEASFVPLEADLPGVTHLHETDTNVPWSIHVAKIDRSRPDLVLHSTLAQGKVSGLATLSDQARMAAPVWGQPLAAVNGDFYVTDNNSPYAGDPRGLQILDGELVSAPTDQPSFWISPDGQPTMGQVESLLEVTWPDGSTLPLGLNEQRLPNRAVLYTSRLGPSTHAPAGGKEFVLEPSGKGPWLPLQPGQSYTARIKEVRTSGNTPLNPKVMVLSVGSALLSAPGGPQAARAGETLRVSTAMLPNLAGVRTAISGGSVLVKDGRKVPLKRAATADYKFRSVFERHPRSAIGADDQFIYLVQVDGRQPRLSMGMTLNELGDYLVKLGCKDALSLDGGASSTFWLNGRVLNSPCHGREREIANGLVVVQQGRNHARAGGAREHRGG
jgi:hypothetical protein